MTTDPVCGISLDQKAPCKSTHAGQTYLFCCLTCKTTFEREAGRYASRARGEPQRREAD